MLIYAFLASACDFDELERLPSFKPLYHVRKKSHHVVEVDNKKLSYITMYVISLKLSSGVKVTAE